MSYTIIKLQNECYSYTHYISIDMHSGGVGDQYDIKDQIDVSYFCVFLIFILKLCFTGVGCSHTLFQGLGWHPHLHPCHSLHHRDGGSGYQGPPPRPLTIFERNENINR